MRNPAIRALCSLQEVDERVFALRKRRDSRPRILESKKRELAAAEKKLVTHKDEKSEADREVDRGNLDLATAEDALAKLEVNRNTAKSNKEYTVLTNEIGDKKLAISKAEDVALAAMSRAETVAGRTPEFEADVVRATRELADLAKDVEAEVERLNGEIATIDADRDERASKIDRDALSRYDRVLEARSGSAMAEVISGACQGCGMTLTPQEQNQVLKASGIVTCKSCARILYSEGE
jgi:predicted  nucleic acid-binding Zn-ribbon protein